MKELAELVPSWSGSLVDDAYAEVAEGLRRERERFAKARFLVVAFRREFDEDGLTEHFDAIEGAASDFDGEKKASLMAAASDERFGRPSWQKTSCEEAEVKAVRKPTIDIARRAYRGFAFKDGGKNAVYCHFEVLQIWTKTTFGDELLSYLGCQDAMIEYLRHRARQPMPAPPPAPTAVLTPCPRCGVALEERSADRSRLSACKRCGGVWLPHDAARAVIAHVGALRIVVAADEATREATGPAAEPRTARCPWDAEPLGRQVVEGIELDVCRVHGVWFDAGEVRQVANAHVEHTHVERAPARAATRESGGDAIDGFFGALDAALDMLDD